MNLDGFDVVAFDGSSTIENTLLIKIPPKLIRHRPDIIALNQSGQVAVGEAKTANDFTRHTHEQLTDFYSSHCTLYIGIPMSAEDKLITALKTLNIPIEDIKIIKVPDRLLLND